ncbi:MAG: exosome complex exonuclease Rrp41 [Thermoproteota archaeon]|jgi:exosome complex component RRP41|nr:exosome complex exonuclease Rrp41 [Thermoproteota archaeon]
MSSYKRVDGRNYDELRPIKAEVRVLKNADGSALFELGNTKVIAAVYGPRELHSKHIAASYESLVRVRYHMVPFSVKERKSQPFTRREIEISKVIKEALSACIRRELFPRSTIDIYVEVLNADGSTRVASLNATALALADAGVFMYDLIAAVSVGKIQGQLIVDLNEYEDQNSEADIPVAFMPSLNKVVLLQMDGIMTYEEMKEALKLARNAAEKIYQIEKECLKSSLESVLKVYGYL